jgi:hypothetical protein
MMLVVEAEQVEKHTRQGRHTMHPLRPAVGVGMALLAMSCNAFPQRDKPRVCVATVANASTVPAMVDRLSDRLTQDLAKGKLDALSMSSSTTLDRELRPSIDNGEEASSKECDYILLTQIYSKRPLTAQGTEPGISTGVGIPSVDASDPMGGSSGPVYREELEVKFAVFRPGKPEAMLDTDIWERSSANVSDSFLQAIDREASRVSYELKKKKH